MRRVVRVPWSLSLGACWCATLPFPGHPTAAIWLVDRVRVRLLPSRRVARYYIAGRLVAELSRVPSTPTSSRRESEIGEAPIPPPFTVLLPTVLVATVLTFRLLYKASLGTFNCRCSPQLSRNLLFSVVFLFVVSGVYRAPLYYNFERVAHRNYIFATLLYQSQNYYLCCRNPA